MQNGAVHELLTRPQDLRDIKEPYAGFYVMCKHRVLFILHLYVRANDLETYDSVCITPDMVEEIAKTCVQKYTAPASTAAFLWGLLTTFGSDERPWVQKEQTLTIPMKEILVGYGVDLVDFLLSWFFADPVEGPGLSLLPVDIDNFRHTMKAVYDPTSP